MLHGDMNIPVPSMPLLHRRKRGSCRVCMLMVTHACNLNCTYCYERHKGSGEMAFETARSIILKELDFVRQSTDFDHLEVDFMGGEPFLNFKLIRQVVEWMEQLDAGVPLVAFCSSNGTCVTPEKHGWLSAHKKTFTVGLSYDGTPAMQRANRTDFSVDIDFFVRTWPQQCVRITVSRETLPFLCEGIWSLHAKKAKVQVALAQGVKWDDRDAEIFRSELKRLSERYLEDGAAGPVALLDKPLYSIAQRGDKAEKTCGAGHGLVTYDIDGVCYPCHMFTPAVLGAEALPLGRSPRFWEEAGGNGACESCLYLNWCPNCHGFNHLCRHDAFKRDHGICRMVDILARACCEFQLKYYHAKRPEITSADGAQIRAALDAFAVLSAHGNDWKTCFKTPEPKGGEEDGRVGKTD